MLVLKAKGRGQVGRVWCVVVVCVCRGGRKNNYYYHTPHT